MPLEYLGCYVVFAFGMGKSARLFSFRHPVIFIVLYIIGCSAGRHISVIGDNCNFIRGLCNNNFVVVCNLVSKPFSTDIKMTDFMMAIYIYVFVC